MLSFSTLVAICVIACTCYTTASPSPSSPSSSAPTLLPIRASSTDRYLYDSLGRVRLFQGVNYVTKYFPWYDPVLLNTTVVQSLADDGFTVIRLGLMWTGAEPTAGNFNATYYQVVRQTIDLLAQYGIYTLLDVHQDGLSSKFCLYDGAPLWVIDKSTPRNPFPWPLKGTCARPWAENELTEAAGQAYQDIYDNTRGMRDDFVNFMSHSAAVFRDAPILGYEIINEPFAGDVYHDPTLFLPGEAGRRNLMPLYDVVAPAIRAQDPNHLIFFEPVTWGMILNNKVLGSGFDHVPGGRAHANMSVYSFHYYCWLMTPNASTLIRTACDAGLGPQVFRAVQSDIAQFGGSSFLTEWGADTCGYNSTECEAVMELATQHWQSWIHWPYIGDEDNFKLLGLTRPYTRALAGSPGPAEFRCLGKVCVYKVCYTINAKITAATEIYIDEPYYFPHGGAYITTTTNLKASKNGKIVSVTPSSPSADGQEGCVTISGVHAEKELNN